MAALTATVFFFLALRPAETAAQCTPDQTMISATHYPTTLKKGCVGEPYNETIYITFPDDSVVSGVNVVFDYFEIVANTLPPGLSYSCNVSNCKWTPGNTPKSQELLFGCITIAGTPTQAFNGQFTISIEGCGTVVFITQCETEVIPFNLSIYNPPVVDFSHSANQNQVDFHDLTTTLQVIDSWSWDFGDGTTSSVQHPSHTYSAPGNYEVCLTVGTVSCTQDFCRTVEVLTVSRDPMSDPMVNGFGRDVQVFPNPASGWLQLEMEEATRPWVGLHSVDGRLMREWQFGGLTGHFRERLDLAGVPGGFYFLDIRAKEGSVVKKVRIQ